MSLIRESVGRQGQNRREDVLILQALLCRQLTAPAPLRPDGLFGPKTAEAIEAFQCRTPHGSDAPGLIEPGSPTLEALGRGVQIHGSVGQRGRNLRLDVIVIQALLNAVGSGAGPLDPLGNVGPRTIESLRAFQTRIGLRHPDGLVGPKGPTFKGLLEASLPEGTPPVQVPAPDPAGGEAPPPIRPQDKAGSLLLSAFKARKTEELTWTEVTVGDLVVTVACDAMKGPLGDTECVRMPVTYEETIAICKELGCVVPNQRIADAMYAQAKVQLNFVPLVWSTADSAKMATIDFVLRFHDGVEEQLKDRRPAAGELVFGAWKLWLLHPRIVERGAINYGFWDKRTKAPVQTIGGQHDAKHYDYSQVLQPVKRIARKVGQAEEVDLLDWFQKVDHVPQKYLDPYR